MGPDEFDEEEFEQWQQERDRKRISLAAGMTLVVDERWLVNWLDGADVRDEMINAAAAALLREVLPSGSWSVHVGDDSEADLGRQARQLVRDQLKAVAEARGAELVGEVLLEDVRRTNHYGEHVGEPKPVREFVIDIVRDELTKPRERGYGRDRTSLIENTVREMTRKWVTDSVKSIADDELKKAREVLREAMSAAVAARVEREGR